MKKLLLLFISFWVWVSQAQNLIAPVSISLPASPSANTADWGTQLPPVMITAQSKLRNGQVPPEVVESKVLVTIRGGNTVVCGSYTASTAPASNFSTAVKNWTGPAAVALLGKDCKLPPGTYELCVQFYAMNAAAGNGLLGEACKTFTIGDDKPQSYSPPQNVMPADGKQMAEKEITQPITFRWTPVWPRPKEDVLYKLRIREISTGQAKMQALKENPVLEEQELKNITQATVRLAKRYNGLIWNVEAVGKEGEKLGTSEPTVFSAPAVTKPANPDQNQCQPPSMIQPAGHIYKLNNKQPLEIKGSSLGDIEKISLLVYKVSDDPSFLQQLDAQGATQVSAAPLESFDYRTRSAGFSVIKNSFPVVAGNNAAERNMKNEKPFKAVLNAADLAQGSYYAVFQQGNCQSLPAPLSVTGNCNVDLSITRISDSCIGFQQGMYVHRICFDVNYQSPTCALQYLNPASGIKVWKNDYSTSYGIISTVPALAGQPQNTTSPTVKSYCITTLIPAAETSVILSVQGDACYTTPVLCQPGAFEPVALTFCKCSFCDNVKWELSNDSVVRPFKDKEGNWYLAVSQEINIAGIQVKSVKAELISFTHRPANGNEECIVCDKNSSTFGNITAGELTTPVWGSLQGVLPVIPGGSGNTHHTMNWFTAAGTTTSFGGNVKLLLSAPPFSTLACCDDVLECCIRYTITTKSCESCSVIVCYGATRKHKKD